MPSLPLLVQNYSIIFSFIQDIRPFSQAAITRQTTPNINRRIAIGSRLRPIISNSLKESIGRLKIAKIQHDNLEDPEASIATLREALESHEWPINDAAYFMGRLAEIYNEDLVDQESCVAILEQMIELFPETRHSANATHRLREMGAL